MVVNPQSIVNTLPSGYGSYIAVSADVDYEVPSDGIMVYQSSTNAVGTIWHLEGGFGFVVSGGTSNANTTVVPVFKGQHWKYITSTGTSDIKFVPFKSVI